MSESDSIAAVPQGLPNVGHVPVLPQQVVDLLLHGEHGRYADLRKRDRYQQNTRQYHREHIDNNPSHDSSPEHMVGEHPARDMGDGVKQTVCSPLTMVDCTLGRGGHAALLIPQLPPGSRYLGLDVDAGNLTFARERLLPLAQQHQITLLTAHCNFASLTQALQQHQLSQVDRLLADLGFASNQMDDAERGFSFAQDGPLDMRLDPSTGTPASQLIGQLGERDLARLIGELGEEPLARKIAAKIVAARIKTPISNTRQLAQLVHECYGARAAFSRTDPATRTFMALRLAVNDELTALQQLLDMLPRVLAPAALAVVIAFHSLEDRLIKRAFADWAQTGRALTLTRKPLMADDDECRLNPRSRSAKLRAVRWAGELSASSF